jgi:hypothetical protein
MPQLHLLLILHKPEAKFLQPNLKQLAQDLWEVNQASELRMQREFNYFENLIYY